MPLNDEQVRRDEELKHIEAKKLRGDELTPEEEKTLSQRDQDSRPEDKPARDEDRPAGKGFK